MNIKKLIVFIIILLNAVFSQVLLKELDISIKIMEKGLSAQPNTSKLIVKSKVPDLRFESNKGIKKVEKITEGEWKLTLYPGSQRLDIKAKSYISYSERHTFVKQKVYECNVKEKSEQEFINLDEDLFEVSFKFNVTEVNCSVDEFLPNLSNSNSATFKLPAGEYIFYFSKNSYGQISQTIKIEKHESFDIELKKDAKYTNEYKLPGVAAIISNPANAEIILDGQKFGYTPANITGISQGEHRLELIKNKYYSNLSNFTIKEGEIRNLNINLVPKFGYLTINSYPDSCEIFMDEHWVGYTPVKRLEYESGKYTLVGKKDLYHEYILKDIEINDGDKESIEFELKPAYGALKIESTPESNAIVIINGKVIGHTPYQNVRFPSGNYTLELRKEYFIPLKESITITDGNTTNRTLFLNSKYGTLRVTSDNAKLFLNNELIIQDSDNIKILPGIYRLRAEKDNYYSEEKNIVVYTGKTETINFNLIPKMGSITIFVEPMNYQKESEIFINGTSYGEAPIIQKLLIGEYEVAAKVNGMDYIQTATIKENQDEPIRFNIDNLQAVIHITQKKPALTKEDERVIDIDGNEYRIIKIGNQIWMADNLQVTHYRNGEPITYITNNNQWSNQIQGAYCNYDNDNKNVLIYGRLYNWQAVNDSRGIAPEGWHIPSSAEWETLFNYLGGRSIAGSKMKSINSSDWWKSNKGGNNESKFSALPGGIRMGNSGNCRHEGLTAIFWFSTGFSNSKAKATGLVYDSFGVSQRKYNKQDGLSIRCIKD